MGRGGVMQRVVATEDRIRVLQGIHDDAGHYGTQLTLKRLLDRYFWPTMMKDVAAFVRSCVNCQRFAPNTTAAAMGEWIVVEPFEVLAWDFIGPMTTSADCKYLLVVVDYATRWVEAEPVKSADHLYLLAMMEFLVTRYGVPRICISDRARSFKSGGLQQRASELGVRWIFSPAYSPKSNGLVERTNKEILNRLRRMVGGNAVEWARHIRRAVFAVNTRLVKSIQCTPFEALLGYEPRYPHEGVVEIQRVQALLQNWREPDETDTLQRIQ